MLMGYRNIYPKKDLENNLTSCIHPFTSVCSLLTTHTKFTINPGRLTGDEKWRFMWEKTGDIDIYGVVSSPVLKMEKSISAGWTGRCTGLLIDDFTTDMYSK